MMTHIGKYIRHAAAWLVGAAAGWFGVGLTAQQTEDLTAGLAVLLIVVIGVVYSTVEKMLKRFRWLDPAAWAERIWSSGAAAILSDVTDTTARNKIERGDV